MRTPLDMVTQVHDAIQVCLDELVVTTPPPALPGDPFGFQLMEFLLAWAALHLRDREAALGHPGDIVLLADPDAQDQ